MKKLALMVMSLVLALAAGCAFPADVAKDDAFNGLKNAQGKKIVAHLNMTRLALNLLVVRPLCGDASMQTAVTAMAKEAKDMGGTNVQIVQSRVSTYWWIFIPISLVITPEISNVAADVIKE